MKYLLIMFLSITVLAGIPRGGIGLNACWAGDKPQLQDEKDKINYSVGYQVAGDLKRQGVEPNAAALVQGVQDALDPTAKPLLTAEEMQTILEELKIKIDARQEQEKKKAIEKYRGEGRAFLAANAKKDGVVSMPSGLQYTILKEGTGKMPKLGDMVTVTYRGTLTNGKEIGHSDKATTLPVNSFVPGWKEALLMMKEGAKWKLFIPADLAFGERGPLAEKVVIYEVDLISVQPAGAK